ncbi:uncharacterized protein [Miscanthus floridulus]|uniref:uncharacterized protein n=1 Tax=Miscanthus floridulus TaxID=154761 RepID=UPI003457F583
MPRRLKTTWAKLNPSSSRCPPTPPTPSSESDLEVNLEDDPDRETTLEGALEPLLVEEVVFNLLETARKEEEDRHLRAIAQKETDDCILKRVVEISKEDERHREEEERRRQEETERRLTMDAERRCRRRAERKKREEEHRRRQLGDDACGSTGSN